MVNRYALFKRNLNSFSYRTFESEAELEKVKDDSENFAGIYVATYDLYEGRYINFPESHGFGSHLEKLLADAQQRYSQGL